MCVAHERYEGCEGRRGEEMRGERGEERRGEESEESEPSYVFLRIISIVKSIINNIDTLFAFNVITWDFCV